jgi:hypothetical protein
MFPHRKSHNMLNSLAISGKTELGLTGCHAVVSRFHYNFAIFRPRSLKLLSDHFRYARPLDRDSSFWQEVETFHRVGRRGFVGFGTYSGKEG